MQIDVLLGISFRGVLGVVRAGRDSRDFADPSDHVVDDVSGVSLDAIVDVVRGGGVRRDVLDGVRIDTGVQELRRDQRQTAEVTFEDVHGSLDGIRVRVAVIGDVAGGRGALGVDEVRELPLEGGADDGFVGAELAGLLVHGGHDVLNVVFRQVIDSQTGADDGRRRGREVGVDRTDHLLVSVGDAILDLLVVALSGEVVLDPRRKAASPVGEVRAVIAGGKDVRGEGELHGALQIERGLGELTGELVLDAGDVEDVLSQVGHVDGAAEHVDVILHFRAVTDRVLLEVVVVLRVSRIDVSAVEDAELDRRIRVAIDLPAEGRVAGLGATLSHRGDGRVLGVDVEDEVRELFSDTDARTG